MTQNEHRNLIVELARLFKPEVYVELGVGSGYVFNDVLPYVRKYAFGCDIDLNEFGGARMYHIGDELTMQVSEISTDKAAKFWPSDLTIDLLFIDADHSAEQVQKDFITWSKFVTPGTGLILLHDTYPCGPKYLKPGYCNDAWKVADKIHRIQQKQGANEHVTNNNARWLMGLDVDIELYGFEIVTLPGPHAGLSIIRKRGKHHLHWMENK